MNSWFPKVTLFLVLFALSAIADQRAIVNFHLDIPRYLYEGELVAKGLVPYRDFTWQYPPASVYFLGWWFKWFGIGFQQAAIFLSAVSSIIALVIYSLCRRAGCSKWAALGIVLYVIFFSWQSCQCELFSLNVYTGALLVGWAFALVSVRFFLAAFDSTGNAKFIWFCLASVSLACAMLSKQESALASLLTLGFMCFVHFLAWLASKKRGSSHAEEKSPFTPFLGFVSVLFGLVIGTASYIAIGSEVGPDNLKQGLEGYGLAGSESMKLLEQIPQILVAWFNEFSEKSDLLILILGSLSLLAVVFLWKKFEITRWLFLTFSATVIISILWRHQFIYPSLFVPWVIECLSAQITIALPILALSFCIAQILQAYQGGPPSRVSASLGGSSLFLVCTLLLSRLYLEGPHFRASVPASLAGVVLVFFLSYPIFAWQKQEQSHKQIEFLNFFRKTSLLLLFILVFAAAYFYRIPGIRSGHAALPISKIETPRGIIYVPQNDSAGFSELIEFSKNEIPQTDSVAVLPYACGINFLLDRPNPFIQTQFQKNRFKGELFTQIMARENQVFPTYFIVQKLERPRWNWVYDLAEIDSPSIWTKLKSHYTRVQTFGESSNTAVELYQIKNPLNRTIP